jgi:hypothetical protein
LQFGFDGPDPESIRHGFAEVESSHGSGSVVLCSPW